LMGKKMNTALAIGGIALAIYLVSKALGKPAVDVSGGGGGGGLLSDLANIVTGGAEKITQAFSEVGGGVINPGGGSETGDLSEAKAWQPTVGVVSPTDVNYSGGYPALDVNEQGLFVNRATGEVYPVDPVTGRQRARVDEFGNVVGRFIASPAGIPYGTYEYSAPPKIGKYGGQAVYKQTLTSLATGQQQQFITGYSAAAGKGFTTPASTGWYSVSAVGSGGGGSKIIQSAAAKSALAATVAAYGL
jgi:hypothetical protein